MGSLYGIFVHDLCIGSLYGDLCMGSLYGIFVWGLCMGSLYTIIV
jgi:hypothetical protein